MTERDNGPHGGTPSAGDIPQTSTAVEPPAKQVFRHGKPIEKIISVANFPNGGFTVEIPPDGRIKL